MKRNWIWAFLLAILFCALLGVSVYSYWDHQTVSVSENRMLTELPELNRDTWFSGGFAMQAEDFVSDHAMFRSDFIAVAQQIEVLIERESDMKLVSRDVDIGVDIDSVDPNIAQTAGSDNAATDQSGDANAAGNGDNAEEADTQQDYLILDDRILSLYVYSESSAQYFVKTINTCFNIVPDYVNKYLLLAPSRIEFEAADLKQYSDPQKPVIDMVYQNVDSLVRTVDCYTPLSQQDVNETYYRTDHHWSQFGAYFAAKAFFETAGVDYVPIEQYDKLTGKPFLGYLYAQNNTVATSLKDYPDTLDYYLYQGINNKEIYYTNAEDGSYLEAEDVMIDPARQGYYTFLQSSCTYLILVGSKTDGSCLLVVGDSYADALVTWFAQSYERIILLDPREYEEGQTGFLNMVRNMGVTDFLIINHVNDLEHVYFTSQIENLTLEAEE
ncbi:MAG: hypothetical protein CVV04_14235 [Firmicutes bacterium HGW-Firmicutes-9]|nr:MAG: hypothetical protein CVV04_14235 [Firmicutes bacterium HGW-Firmicutes-9]